MTVRLTFLIMNRRWKVCGSGVVVVVVGVSVSCVFLSFSLFLLVSSISASSNAFSRAVFAASSVSVGVGDVEGLLASLGSGGSGVPTSVSAMVDGIFLALSPTAKFLALLRLLAGETIGISSHMNEDQSENMGSYNGMGGA